MDICKRAQSILQKRRQATSKHDEDSLSGMSEFDHDFHQEKSVETIGPSSEVGQAIKSTATTIINRCNELNEKADGGDATDIEFGSDLESISDRSDQVANKIAINIKVDQDEYISFDDDQMSEKSILHPTISLSKHKSFSDTQKTLNITYQESRASLISFDDEIESQSRISAEALAEDGITIAYSDDFEDAISTLSNIQGQSNEELDVSYNNEFLYSKDFKDTESEYEQLNEQILKMHRIEPFQTQFQQPDTLSSILITKSGRNEKEERQKKSGERIVEQLLDERTVQESRIAKSDVAVQANERIDQCIQVNRLDKFQGIFYIDPRLDLVPENISARLSAVVNRIQISRDQLHQDQRMLSYKKYTTLRDIELRIAKIQQQRR